MDGAKSIEILDFDNSDAPIERYAEPIAVERHGRVIGYYVPVKRDNALMRKAVEQHQRVIHELLDATGLTEDELAILLDPNQSFAK